MCQANKAGNPEGAGARGEQQRSVTEKIQKKKTQSPGRECREKETAEDKNGGQKTY